MRDVFQELWTLLWIGVRALTILGLAVLLFAGPATLALLGRLFFSRMAGWGKTSPQPARIDPQELPSRAGHAWPSGGLPLGPRWN